VNSEETFKSGLRFLRLRETERRRKRKISPIGSRLLLTDCPADTGFAWPAIV
jgi:hypothetical protein